MALGEKKITEPDGAWTLLSEPVRVPHVATGEPRKPSGFILCNVAKAFSFHGKSYLHV